MFTLPQTHPTLSWMWLFEVSCPSLINCSLSHSTCTCRHSSQPFITFLTCRHMRAIFPMWESSKQLYAALFIEKNPLHPLLNLRRCDYFLILSLQFFWHPQNKLLKQNHISNDNRFLDEFCHLTSLPAGSET